jgi:hypothetical protein
MPDLPRNRSRAKDIRHRMFSGSPWFDALRKPRSVEEESAWYLLKDRAPEWNVCLLKAALRYAERRGVWEHYRNRFEKISAKQFLPARVAADNRSVTFPIWEIASELVVGAYLEHVLGWRFRCHEPPGRGTAKGDWEFETRNNRIVFVEVKTVREPPFRASAGVYSRPSYAKRLTDTLKRAYPQLPEDGRATLVVLVGDQYVRPSIGIVHSDLFAALFGHFILEFPIDSAPPKVSYAGPSFREMFLGRQKNRRLGVVAGLAVRGLFEPALLFYAVHNPFAKRAVRLNQRALADAWRVAWRRRGGHVVGKPNAPAAWARISGALLGEEDGCPAPNTR